MTWGVKVSSAKVGPGPNVFSDSKDDVDVVAGGLLLTIRKSGSQWRCTEVIGTETLGYGTYRWTIASSVGKLDPSVVLGLFTWNDLPDENHREIDIEFAKWSNTSTGMEGQYTVQPWDGPNHRLMFDHEIETPTTHEFQWAPGKVVFRSWDGADTSNSPKRTWTFDRLGEVPTSKGENTRMNLWLFRGKAPVSGKPVEVILSDFTFTPAPLP